MAKYEDKHQIDYRQGGDTVDDFAQKYMANMVSIFRYLNDLRTLNTNNIDYTEPEPNQFRASDGKLYIRNNDNTAWILLGEIKVNFGFKSSSDVKFVDNTTFKFESGKIYAREFTDDEWTLLGDMKENFGFKANSGVKLVDDTTFKFENGKIYARESIDDDWVILGEMKDNFGFRADKSDTFITASEVTTLPNQPNKIMRTDANGILNVDISGNAGRLAGKTAEINNLQDGQVLTFRAASGSWRNEDKGVVGAGKALAVVSGEEVLFEYSGDAPHVLDLAVQSPFFKDENGNILLRKL